MDKIYASLHMLDDPQKSLAATSFRFLSSIFRPSGTLLVASGAHSLQLVFLSLDLTPLFFFFPFQLSWTIWSTILVVLVPEQRHGMGLVRREGKKRRKKPHHSMVLVDTEDP